MTATTIAAPAPVVVTTPSPGRDLRAASSKAEGPVQPYPAIVDRLDAAHDAGAV